MREKVIKRARNCCEYCLININDTFFGGEIDHIISVKHGGKATFSNLALACQPCNRSKGSDVGSVARKTQEFVRFFNPRIDIWVEHFEVKVGKIIGITEIGKVTAKIFEFNNFERIAERNGLIKLNKYPPQK